MTRADEIERAAATPEVPDTKARYSIGAAAKRLEVSTRTLRYYQELGLLDPAGASPGGNRRYSDADLKRAQRILELRNVMGFDLDRIGDILRAEDQLDAYRQEVRAGVTQDRRRQILSDAIEINAQLRAQVSERAATLAEFAADLDATRLRYLDLAKTLGLETNPD